MSEFGFTLISAHCELWVLEIRTLRECSNSIQICGTLHTFGVFGMTLQPLLSTLYLDQLYPDSFYPLLSLFSNFMNLFV